MKDERWEKLMQLFDAARNLPSGEQSAFVHSNTADDPDLAAELMRLLQFDAGSSFLDADAGSVLAEIDSVVRPGATIGPFKIRTELGTGGMGRVYLAEHEGWNRLVAIKIPRNIFVSQDQRGRFQNEQILLSQLAHPSIARIYEGGTLHGGAPWFAMEYIQGSPITDYCADNKLSVRDCLQLFVSVCQAVEYAHSKLIVHRDLKPSNILVTENGEAKLLDFGIAKQIGNMIDQGAKTRVGDHPLTLAYAPPEQIVANDISTQTDVYSLGVVLYELLAGRLPFDLSNLTPAQATDLIRTKDPQKPSTAAAGKPPSLLTRNEWSDLDVLVLTAMHKDLRKRYGSVAALREDIERYLGNEPLLARPDTFSYRSRKFVARNLTPVIASASAALIAVSLVTYYTVRLRQARDAALQEAAHARNARNFTNDLLSGGDAENGPSKDLRVLDFLKFAVPKVAAIKDDPIQQGELYMTFGSLFNGLADFKTGDDLLHRAYRILSIAEPHSHDMAELLGELGVMYSNEGQAVHAQTLMRKAIAIEEHIDPPDNALIHRYKIALAYATVDKQSVISILLPLLQEPSLRSEPQNQALVWTLLATAYLELNRPDEAEPFEMRVLAYDERTKPNSVDVAQDLINVAAMQRGRSDWAGAEQSFRHVLKIYEAFYPPHHPEIADVKRMLAETLLHEDRTDEAASLAGAALADTRTAYGDRNARVAYAYLLNGRVAMARNSPEAAEHDIKQCITILRALDQRINLPVALRYLGDVYARRKSFAQAERTYRDAVAAFGQSPAEHTDQLGITESELGDALLQERRYSDAEAHLVSASALLANNTSKTSAQLAATRKDLLAVYSALQEHSKFRTLQTEVTETKAGKATAPIQ